ncbi:MAG: hypothetical protein JHC87_09115, partial [Thermoleophilaceae bacterium]|nr:hypothetical protein [Thermoleophilaceae bacterium]
MTKPDTSPNDFKLNRLPTSLVKAFRDLPAPASAAAAIGEYRSAYIGPAFIRVPAPLIMKAARFGGWHGKVFRANAGDDQVLDGMNMFGDVAARNERFPMTASIGPSSIDG